MSTKVDKQQTRRQERKAAGLCPDCGRPRAEGGVQCAACRERTRVAVQRFKRRHPERYEQQRDWLLRTRYGITLAQQRELLAKQGGRCAICQRPLRVPHVDHDHTTGRVRGLLCASCNAGMGSLGDSIERLQAAQKYLEAGGVETTL